MTCIDYKSMQYSQNDIDLYMIKHAIRLPGVASTNHSESMTIFD